MSLVDDLSRAQPHAAAAAASEGERKAAAGTSRPVATINQDIKAAVKDLGAIIQEETKAWGAIDQYAERITGLQQLFAERHQAEGKTACDIYEDHPEKSPLCFCRLNNDFLQTLQNRIAFVKRQIATLPQLELNSDAHKNQQRGIGIHLENTRKKIYFVCCKLS